MKESAPRIFLIDDDDDDLAFFSEAINDLARGIEIYHSHNGEAGLKLLETALPLPDYIFLDLNMPRMNGRTFLKKLKSRADFIHIPVIIYTTSKHDRDIDDTRKLGASWFLTKPSKLEELKKALLVILDMFENEDAAVPAGIMHL